MSWCVKRYRTSIHKQNDDNNDFSHFWDRDVNAARNIRAVGLHALYNQGVLPSWQINRILLTRTAYQTSTVFRRGGVNVDLLQQ